MGRHYGYVSVLISLNFPNKYSTQLILMLPFLPPINNSQLYYLLVIQIYQWKVNPNRKSLNFPGINPKLGRIIECDKRHTATQKLLLEMVGFDCSGGQYTYKKNSTPPLISVLNDQGTSIYIYLKKTQM